MREPHDSGQPPAMALAPDLALERRDGLPDALKVLLEAYPRSGWSADPGFDGLIRFWLDRHLMFRRLLALLTRDVRVRLDGGLGEDRFAAGLARHGGMLVNELHGHHMIEDQHYFPVLSRKDPRIETGFALLDSDHHALDRHLAGFVTAANAVLQPPAGTVTGAAARDATGRLDADLGRLTRLIDRHLTDEEDLVVPVILRHGTAGLP